MPGTGRSPITPRRTLTFSRDRLGFSNGSGAIGLAFGLVFSSTGVLAIVAGASALLAYFGLLRSSDVELVKQQLRWQELLPIGGLFLIGAGHLFIGSLLLTTLRCSFDRTHKTVTVRTGWLGFRKVIAILSDFDRISVRQATPWRYRDDTNPTFNIVLVRPDNGRQVVAYTTRSIDAAREVALELREFTGLPLEASATDPQTGAT